VVFFGGLRASVIEDQDRKAQEERHAPGRPPSLAKPIRDWIEKLIAERFQARNPIIYAELLDLLEYHHSIAISADTLRHRINAIDSLKTVTGAPMEADGWDEARVALDIIFSSEACGRSKKQITGRRL
jgi:hypothetical protein